MMRRLILAAPAYSPAPALAESPLADAVENGRRDVALGLIQKGADVNAAQGDGTTARALGRVPARCRNSCGELLSMARRRTRMNATARAHRRSRKGCECRAS